MTSSISSFSRLLKIEAVYNLLFQCQYIKKSAYKLKTDQQQSPIKIGYSNKYILLCEDKEENITLLEPVPIMTGLM